MQSKTYSASRTAYRNWIAALCPQLCNRTKSIPASWFVSRRAKSGRCGKGLLKRRGCGEISSNFWWMQLRQRRNRVAHSRTVQHYVGVSDRSLSGFKAGLPDQCFQSVTIHVHSDLLRQDNSRMMPSCKVTNCRQGVSKCSMPCPFPVSAISVSERHDM